MQIGSIAIVGAGAVGSYYGCRMAEAGHDVRFLLRSDFEEVLKTGFQIQSVHGDFAIESPQVFRTSQDIGPVDLVVVAWKATANEKAEEVISPLMNEKTRILTLQNGLGNVELLESLFGRGRILGGLCFVGINRLAAGQISHSVGGMVTVGEPVETGVLSEMATVFGDKVEVKIADNLALAQWRKLIWNIPFNGLCVTEGGIDTQELLALEDGEERVLSLMKEVQKTAEAAGHEIPDHFLAGQMEATHKMGAYKPSSMLDYVNGYPLEVEAIWGEPLRIAGGAGLSVPCLRAVYEKLVALNPGR